MKTKRAKPGKVAKTKPRAKAAASKEPAPPPADKKRRNKTGPESAFKPEYIEMAQKMCQKGLTDMEIADVFGICRRQLIRWKSMFPGLAEAMQSGKDIADARVERSLYARAVGYEFDEDVLHVIDKKVVATTVRKQMPPDTTAGIFWLKNRNGLQWRDTYRRELTGADGGPVQTESPALEDVGRRLAFLLAKAAKKAGQ